MGDTEGAGVSGGIGLGLQGYVVEGGDGEGESVVVGDGGGAARGGDAAGATGGGEVAEIDEEGLAGLDVAIVEEGDGDVFGTSPWVPAKFRVPELAV